MGGVDPINNDKGVRVIPLQFGSIQGRVLPSIINKKGEVFQPNPYDLPYDPFRCLSFALHLVCTMIDDGTITSYDKTTSDTLQLRSEYLSKYRASTQNLINQLEMLEAPDGSRITKQEQSKISRREKIKIREANK
jgi:hypothetical protein